MCIPSQYKCVGLFVKKTQRRGHSVHKIQCPSDLKFNLGKIGWFIFYLVWQTMLKHCYRTNHW
jgi:hypothetical protein